LNAPPPLPPRAPTVFDAVQNQPPTTTTTTTTTTRTIREGYCNIHPMVKFSLNGTCRNCRAMRKPVKTIGKNLTEANKIRRSIVADIRKEEKVDKSMKRYSKTLKDGYKLKKKQKEDKKNEGKNLETCTKLLEELEEQSSDEDGDVPMN